MTEPDDRGRRLDDEELDRALERVFADGASPGSRQTRTEVGGDDGAAGGVAPVGERGRDASGAATPTVLGDYRIVRELGRGAMGVVYLAEEAALGRRVALKVLPAHLTLREEMIQRFRIEAGCAARLRHPGIAQVYRVDEDAGHHFFAMELLEGSSLQDVVELLRERAVESLDGEAFGLAVREVRDRAGEERAEDAPLPPVWRCSYVELICRLVAQIADALQHAHEAGIIHRDVKPSNVMIREDATAVLTDFGLARGEGQPHLTQTGVVAGTPHYMSPEQARPGGAPVDRRSDVFALGSTLYELLTLQHPFRGSTVHRVLERIARHEPHNPRRLNRRLPLDLATITLKALEKDPGRRYQSAAELAADLRAFLRYEPIKARPASVGTRVSKLVRRNRTAAAGIALACAVGAAAAGWWWSRDATLRIESPTDGATVYLDGVPIGLTNQDLRVVPGLHGWRVEKPPELFSLASNPEPFERGGRLVERIELTDYARFRRLLIDGDREGEQWLARGLPERFRDGIADDLEVLQGQLVDALAASDVEAAVELERQIQRLDRLDAARAVSRAAAALRDAYRSADEERSRLYRVAREVVDAGAEPERALRLIDELARLRFEGRRFATDDAEDLTAALARRLVKIAGEQIDGEQLEQARRTLFLLEDADERHPELAYLRRRLEAADAGRTRVDLLARARDLRRSGVPDPALVRDILGQLQTLAADGAVLGEVEEILAASRFRVWLDESRIVLAARDAVESGSLDEIRAVSSRLGSGADRARPRPGEEPVAEYQRIERALAAAVRVVERCTAVATQSDHAEARRELQALRAVELPQPLAVARDALVHAVAAEIDARERSSEVQARCATMLAACVRDTARLRLDDASVRLDGVRDLAGELGPSSSAGVAADIERCAGELAAAVAAERELDDLLVPFRFFVTGPVPIETATAVRSWQTLERRLLDHGRRLAAAIAREEEPARAAELRLRRANVALCARDWRAAIEETRVVIRTRPSAAAHLAAARALHGEAVGTGELALLREAMDHLDRAAAAGSGDPAVAYLRGVCGLTLAAATGDAPESADPVDDLLAAAAAVGSAAGEIHCLIAQVLQRRLEPGAPAASAAYLERVVRHANAALDALDAAAAALDERGDAEVFAASVRRLRRDALIARGNAYWAAERWNAAISTFDEAIRVDDTHAWSHLWLANALTGPRTEACYQRALDALKRVETLTTDDRLLGTAERLKHEIHVAIHKRP